MACVCVCVPATLAAGSLTSGGRGVVVAVRRGGGGGSPSPAASRASASPCPARLRLVRPRRLPRWGVGFGHVRAREPPGGKPGSNASEGEPWLGRGSASGSRPPCNPALAPLRKRLQRGVGFGPVLRAPLGLGCRGRRRRVVCLVLRPRGTRRVPSRLSCFPCPRKSPAGRRESAGSPRPRTRVPRTRGAPGGCGCPDREGWTGGGLPGLDGSGAGCREGGRLMAGALGRCRSPVPGSRRCGGCGRPGGVRWVPSVAARPRRYPGGVPDAVGGPCACRVPPRRGFLSERGMLLEGLDHDPAAPARSCPRRCMCGLRGEVAKRGRDPASSPGPTLSVWAVGAPGARFPAFGRQGPGFPWGRKGSVIPSAGAAGRELKAVVPLLPFAPFLRSASARGRMSFRFSRSVLADAAEPPRPHRWGGVGGAEAPAPAAREGSPRRVGQRGPRRSGAGVGPARSSERLPSEMGNWGWRDRPGVPWSLVPTAPRGWGENSPAPLRCAVLARRWGVGGLSAPILSRVPSAFWRGGLKIGDSLGRSGGAGA